MLSGSRNRTSAGPHYCGFVPRPAPVVERAGLEPATLGTCFCAAQPSALPIELPPLVFSCGAPIRSCGVSRFSAPLDDRLGTTPLTCSAKPHERPRCYVLSRVIIPRQTIGIRAVAFGPDRSRGRRNPTLQRERRDRPSSAVIRISSEPLGRHPYPPAEVGSWGFEPHALRECLNSPRMPRRAARCQTNPLAMPSACAESCKYGCLSVVGSASTPPACSAKLHKRRSTCD